LLIRQLHPEGMKINQPGVARQRYPGVNAESISTLKRVVSAGLGICSPGISAGQKNFVAPPLPHGKKTPAGSE
jgi:hypothetical protein